MIDGMRKKTIKTPSSSKNIFDLLLVLRYCDIFTCSDGLGLIIKFIVDFPALVSIEIDSSRKGSDAASR